VAKSLITLTSSGDFRKTTAYLNRLKQIHILTVLNRYGSRGVSVLQAATPVESGETAASWYYTIEASNGKYTISFHNRHVENGAPIAILLQYGHGTRNGGYVVGHDFINPAVQPIFDQIKSDVWKEVTSA
jgi:hypothetical protein